MKNKIFSLDAETDGLWGNPFAVAAIVYKDGAEVDRICLRLPDFFVTNQWVKDNVLPTLNTPVTHEISSHDFSYDDLKLPYEMMLKDFASFYMKHKDEADIICHMGYIVEAHLLREMHRLAFLGEWDAPYPLLDISGNLQAAGEDPTSVDTYAKKNGLEVSDFGTTHNPLYDCEVAAKVYIHLNKASEL